MILQDVSPHYSFYHLLPPQKTFRTWISCLICLNKCCKIIKVHYRTYLLTTDFEAWDIWSVIVRANTMLKSDLLWGLTGLLNVWDMPPMGIHTIKICTITSSNEMEKLPFMYVFITTIHVCFYHKRCSSGEAKTEVHNNEILKVYITHILKATKQLST